MIIDGVTAFDNTQTQSAGVSVQVFGYKPAEFDADGNQTASASSRLDGIMRDLEIQNLSSGVTLNFPLQFLDDEWSEVSGDYTLTKVSGNAITPTAEWANLDFSLNSDRYMSSLEIWRNPQHEIGYSWYFDGDISYSRSAGEIDGLYVKTNTFGFDRYMSYLLTFRVDEYTAGGLTFSIRGGEEYTMPTELGTHEIEIIAGIDASASTGFTATSTDTELTISNVSLKQYVSA